MCTYWKRDVCRKKNTGLTQTHTLFNAGRYRERARVRVRVRTLENIWEKSKQPPETDSNVRWYYFDAGCLCIYTCVHHIYCVLFWTHDYSTCCRVTIRKCMIIWYVWSLIYLFIFRLKMMKFRRYPKCISIWSLNCHKLV